MLVNLVKVELLSLLRLSSLSIIVLLKEDVDGNQILFHHLLFVIPVSVTFFEVGLKPKKESMELYPFSVLLACYNQINSYNYIFNNTIKHIKVGRWTKLVYRELAKEPKFWPSYITEPTDTLVLN